MNTSAPTTPRTSRFSAPSGPTPTGSAKPNNSAIQITLRSPSDPACRVVAPSEDGEIAALRAEIEILETKLALYRRREQLDLEYTRCLTIAQRRQLIAPVLEAVSREFHIAVESFIHPRGTRTPDHIAIPRMLAVALAREIHQISTYDLAPLFGYREHSMICYGVKITQNRLDTDPAFAARVARIRSSLGRTGAPPVNEGASPEFLPHTGGAK